MISGLNLWGRLIRIDFNWINLHLVLISILLGFYGYASDQNPLIMVFFLLIPVMMWRSHSHVKKFDDHFSFNLNSIAYFIYFFLLLGINARDYLFNYPSGDELAYSLIGIQPILSAILKFSSVDSLTVVIVLIRFIFLTIFVIAVFSYFKLRKIPHICIIILVFTIVINLTIFRFFGGFPGGYSKLNTLPYIFIPSLFGFNGFTLHITSTLFMSGLFILILRYFEKNSKLQFLATFVALTLFSFMPAFLYLSSLIDHSIFFILFSLPPLIRVFLNDTSNQARWIGFISIGIYFRITVLITLILYLMFIGIRKIRIQEFGLPIFLIGPYLVTLLLTSNPDVTNSDKSILEPGEFLSRLESLLSSIKLTQTNLEIMTLVILLCLIPFRDRRVFYLTLRLIFLIVVFFSLLLNKDLVGNAKYALEWFLTLFVLLSIFWISRLKKMFGDFSIVYILIVSMLLNSVFLNSSKLPLNLIIRHSVSAERFSFVNQTGRFNEVNPVFNYQKALRISKTAYGKFCLPIGNVYGEYLQVLAGGTVKEINIAKEERLLYLNALQTSGRDFDEIDARLLTNIDVDCFILPSRYNGVQFRDLLQDNSLKIDTTVSSKFPDSNLLIVSKLHYKGV